MQERRQEAWAKWRGLAKEQGASGQSVAAFCRDRGLSASQLFAWKKRLRQTAAEPFVEVQIVGAPARQATARGRAIEVRLTGGRSVMVEPGFDGDHLRALLAALEGRL